MMRSSDRFKFDDNYAVKFNSDSDDLFIIFDYGRRTHHVNMTLQHYHDTHEIAICLEDTGVTHIVEGMKYVVARNDMVFLKPGRMHMALYPKDGAAHRRIIINFSLLSGNTILDYHMKKLLKVFDQEVPVLRLPPDVLPLAAGAINDIFTLGKRQEPGWQAEFLAKFIDFLYIVNEHLGENMYVASSRADSLDQRIHNILNYISSRQGERPGLEEVAREFNISPFHLSHQFRRLTGFTFTGYTQMIMVNTAMNALNDPDIPIRDVIEISGFSSASQFNRVFKKLCGMNPTEFRKADSWRRSAAVKATSPGLPHLAPPLLRPSSAQDGGEEAPVVGVDLTCFGRTSPGELAPLARMTGAELFSIDFLAVIPGAGSHADISQADLLAINSMGVDLAFMNCKIDLPSDGLDKTLAELSHAIHTASDIGARCLVFRTGAATTGNKMERQTELMKLVEGLLPIAERYNVGVAVTPAAGEVIDSAQMTRKILDTFPSKYFRVVLDPVALVGGNLVINEPSFHGAAISLLEDSLEAIVLTDRLADKDAPLGAGAMSGIYPRLSQYMAAACPVIRGPMPIDSMFHDIQYMRNLF